MVLILLANGFEDAEVFVPTDILRRGGLEVRLVSTELTAEVTSARGITIFCDYVVENVLPTKEDTVVVPGGSKGVAAILANRNALNLVEDGMKQNARLAAICAGPTVLAALGILDGKNATCYPGCEGQMGKAICHPEVSICEDGKILTARAAGSAFDFGFAILENTRGKAAADKIRADMCY